VEEKLAGKKGLPLPLPFILDTVADYNCSNQIVKKKMQKL